MAFYGRYVTDHCLEIMMACFNVVFHLLNYTYRFPVKVATLKKWINLNNNACSGVKEYVMCSKCNSLYRYNTNEEKQHLNGRVCTFKGTLTSSKKCGNNLFLTIETNGSAKKNHHKPIKNFFYNSLIDSIKQLLKQNFFVQLLKERFNNKRPQPPPNFTSDVQQGSVFTKFSLKNDGFPFVEESPYNLLLQLNLDWFNPFDYSSYSVGGIWLSILNLPHKERLQRKNTILSSILPGPKEVCHQDMPKIIQPLVDELQLLQNGIDMINSKGENVKVKVCLVMVSADLPALR